MQANIEIRCPHCHSAKIVKNGKTHNGSQNYRCKECKHQFIADHEKKYRGCLSWIVAMIKMMLIRGSGIRDIAEVLGISIGKVLSTLKNSRYEIKPKKDHYDTLEIDEFWTYVGSKKHKFWLIYAYDRETSEIVAYQWGKRDRKTAEKLLDKIKTLGITYNWFATDWWESFLRAFSDENHKIGKEFTSGIEGNNCLLRCRMRRVFRKSCCFSKKLVYHLREFKMAFYYINY
ncbi:IS1 family transposase, partial [Breznakiellaceae bacterium SP9]